MLDPGGTHRVVFIDDGDTRLASDSGAVKIEISATNDQVVLGGGTPATSSWEVTVNNDLYAVGTVSAATITDRTPYPSNLEEAYASVLSMQRLPRDQYDPKDSEKQLDHSRLHPFIRHSVDGEVGRNLSAAVSAQNEVIKDLMNRITVLEQKYDELQKQQKKRTRHDALIQQR